MIINKFLSYILKQVLSTADRSSKIMDQKMETFS